MSCKWLFKIKERIEGIQQPRYKARLVARGFTNRAGIDCNEVFSMVVRHTSIRGVRIKGLGGAKKILGMEIVRDQSLKILRVSQDFRIDNRRLVRMPLGGHFKLSLKDCPFRDSDIEMISKVPYANAVGNLMYLLVCTRPNIAYVVSVVSRYLANLGFVELDYAKDPDKGRSITGYTFLIHGCVGAILLSRNHVFHERTKHINVRCHFLKEVLEAKMVNVLKVGTEHNVTDALIKVVPKHKLQHYLELLSVDIG
ncbi:retrovirus-related pol polyprotein from transposon TNT 1-94 [Tanacetum coccineum]